MSMDSINDHYKVGCKIGLVARMIHFMTDMTYNQSRKSKTTSNEEYFRDLYKNDSNTLKNGT